MRVCDEVLLVHSAVEGAVTDKRQDDGGGSEVSGDRATKNPAA